jgi:transcriptional regulator with XRE-family HTH domain
MHDSFPVCLDLVYKSRMTAGDRIRQARERAGLTVRQLAELLGVSVGMIAHWENGNKPVTAKRLAQIAEVTLTDPSVLLRDKAGNPTEPQLSDPGEIALVRAYRKMSERQQQNLLKLIQVSVNIRREIEHLPRPLIWLAW